MAETEEAIRKTKEASLALRKMPGPKRGEVIRQIRGALESKVQELGDLVTLEMGKIRSEGKGEVQEVSRSFQTLSRDVTDRAVHRCCMLAREPGRASGGLGGTDWVSATMQQACRGPCRAGCSRPNGPSTSSTKVSSSPTGNVYVRRRVLICISPQPARGRWHLVGI